MTITSSKKRLDFMPVADPIFDEEERDNLLECIDTGWISSKGTFVPAFEEKIAEFLGVKYALAISSGTAALATALYAEGIRKGDKVIIPNYTFIATATACLFIGAIPVIVDIEPTSWAINCTKIEDLLERQSDKQRKEFKAIIPVAISGFPWDTQGLDAIAKNYNLIIIGDLAQALGTTIIDLKIEDTRTKHITNLDISLAQYCDSAIYSLFANKIITTGEGGILITSSEETYRAAKTFINQGIAKEDEATFIARSLGFNFRMTNLQAAIGVAQLGKIDTLLDHKKSVTNWYRELITDNNAFYSPNTPKIRDNINIPDIYTQGISIDLKNTVGKITRWMFRIAFKDLISDRLIRTTRQALLSNGYETKPLYPPLNTQPILIELEKEKLVIFDRDLAFSEQLNGFYVPTHGGMSEKNVREIAITIQEKTNLKLTIPNKIPVRLPAKHPHYGPNGPVM